MCVCGGGGGGSGGAVSRGKISLCRAVSRAGRQRPSFPAQKSPTRHTPLSFSFSVQFQFPCLFPVAQVVKLYVVRAPQRPVHDP